MNEPRPAGSAADVRRWAEDRRIANAVEVRDLETEWATPERSIAAALDLMDLWATLHGWPPPEDPIDVLQDHEVWERFARLRRPYVR